MAYNVSGSGKAKEEKPSPDERHSNKSADIVSDSKTLNIIEDKASLKEIPRVRVPEPTLTTTAKPLPTKLASLPPLLIDVNALMKQAPRPILSRGLVNDGNMCFLNAILQSLLHCTPLCNLVTLLIQRSSLLRSDFELKDEHPMPFLHAFSFLYRQFTDLIEVETSHPSLGHASSPSQLTPLIPSMIHDALKRCSRPSTPFILSGAQEDAEEFLTYFIGELHAELIDNQEELNWRLLSNEQDEKSSAGTEKGSWMEITKQKVAVTRTHSELPSPISQLFSGQFKSILKQSGLKDSITSEPFQCLPLEIDSEQVTDISSALTNLTSIEHLLGDNKKTHVKRTKQVLLDLLPPVLVIHLKRFVYKQGVIKLLKHIHTPDFFSFPPSCLSELGRLLYKDKVYVLRSVIYHHGKYAGGGHYTAHCKKVESKKGNKKANNSTWWYFDDNIVRREQKQQNITEDLPEEEQTPYILFYELQDENSAELGGSSKKERDKNNKEGKGSVGSRFAHLLQLPE